MTQNADYIYQGASRLSPYLIVQDATAAIAFYAKVFGAEERMRMPGHDGRVMHAELMIGDSSFMLADTVPQMGYLDPRALGNTPVSLLLYMPDVDAVFAACEAAGAEVVKPVADQFWGDRMGTLRDPFGHVWSIATNKEKVPQAEMQARMDAAMKEQAKAG